VVFKRRDRRPVWQIVQHSLWPRGGWARAARYVRHRLHRLPDTPEKISRGVAAGVFTTFTPFYGFHFVVAALLALLLRGNLVAALLSTFFGNPLTYVPIGIVSLQTGYWLLGTRPAQDVEEGFLRKFSGAGGDLWHNFKALFTPEVAEWARLARFYDDVFLPYLIGGLAPGVIAGAIAYFVALPIIRAYQNRRKNRLRAKLQKLKTGELP